MPAASRLTTVLALILTAFLAHAAGPTGLLNDTGQTSCYNGTNTAVACDSSGVGSDADARPRQDARFGRDAAQAAGVLPAKTGGGAAGFDFTKVCANGDLAGQGTCAANPTTGDANPWACTKDNVTNLVWSIESFSGKTWADATDATGGSLIDGYNTASRCGFNSGWRVPSRRELLLIVHGGAVSPAIDTSYFPSTAASYYWSNDSSAANSTYAWNVYFVNGLTSTSDKGTSFYVRLVHNGP